MCVGPGMQRRLPDAPLATLHWLPSPHYQRSWPSSPSCHRCLSQHRRTISMHVSCMSCMCMLEKFARSKWTCTISSLMTSSSTSCGTRAAASAKLAIHTACVQWMQSCGRCAPGRTQLAAPHLSCSEDVQGAVTDRCRMRCGGSPRSPTTSLAALSQRCCDWTAACKDSLQHC